MVSIEQSKYYEYYRMEMKIKEPKELQRQVQKVKDIHKSLEFAKAQRVVDVKI